MQIWLDTRVVIIVIRNLFPIPPYLDTDSTDGSDNDTQF